PGIADASEASDNFGASLAWGDFDGDGYDDLAAGISGENPSGVAGAGAVAVLYGSGTGLSGAGSQLWHQNSPGILDLAEIDDHFGASLASGDADGDGYADVVIGVPEENVGAVADAGVINVLYGSASGLASGGNQVWHQNSPGIADAAEASDRFGAAL
ncbi:MAG: FG-GAP repeat protein, partial [Acidimicrobiia bacterium]